MGVDSMRAIGLRVYSNSKVYYTLVQRNDNGTTVLLSVAAITVPLALTLPERLNYVRKTLIDILAEYQVSNAVVRVQESVQRIPTTIIERCYLEGVILECLSETEIIRHAVGRISNISGLIGIERPQFKVIRDEATSYDFLPEGMDWTSFSKEEKESILASHAALML